jgi:hypothetical protein
VAELNVEAKLRLVTLLAQFSGPSQAARIVSGEFGVTLTRAQAWKYDATRPGCRMSPDLKRVFLEVRERWLSRVSEIGVANKGHRLRALDRLAAKLESQGDYHGALSALEQAAREVGGFFEKRAIEREPKSGAAAAKLCGHANDFAAARAELQIRLQGFVASMETGPNWAAELPLP